jgi:methyl coenzyme M reductase subunit C-like uncharacterized protein (methanogenesis marker protein 7)
MQDLNEDKLTKIVIDLSQENRLDEFWLGTFGYWVKRILQSMFGDVKIPVEIKGSPGDVQSFASALGREKKYMDSLSKYGLNNPKTYKNKSKLNRAVKEFTRKTGLKWPFK